MRALLSSPTITYCEAALDGIIKRPWYALSNIAFFVSAYLIYQTEKTRLARQFAFITAMVGVLSLLYDTTYTYLSQLLDLAAMLLFVSLLVYLNLKALYPKFRAIFWLTIVGIAALLAIIYFGAYSGNVIFGLYIITVIITEAILLRTGKHKNGKLWLIALLVFASGFAIWLFDASKVYCFDFGLLNGRAIFHYTSAFVMYQMFRFYRLQTVPDKNR